MISKRPQVTAHLKLITDIFCEINIYISTNNRSMISAVKHLWKLFFSMEVLAFMCVRVCLYVCACVCEGVAAVCWVIWEPQHAYRLLDRWFSTFNCSHLLCVSVSLPTNSLSVSILVYLLFCLSFHTIIASLNSHLEVSTLYLVYTVFINLHLI